MSNTSLGDGTIPKVPEFNSVIDDSPAFHQSLKYWTYKSSQIGSAAGEIASSLHEYHNSGTRHQASGNGLSEILNRSSHIFKGDDLLEEPLAVFADTISRIECYRSMLLTQTEMLGVEPLMDMAKMMEKTKKCRNRGMKLAEAMHISWEKFAAMPHISNLHDPHQLDRNAHHVITLQQKYQLLLVEYIENIQDVNTLKKVALLQKVLEHMFAEFSYFNFCAQILKDLEPYMTDLFEKLQKKQRECEQVALLNDSFRREVEMKIDVEAQSKRKLFPHGEQSATSTTPTFLNKFGGFISSGVKDLRKQYNATSPNKKSVEEPDWEVIDNIEKTDNTAETSQFYVALNKVEEDETSTDNSEHDKETDVEDPELSTDNVNIKSDTTDNGVFGNDEASHTEINDEKEKDTTHESISTAGIRRSNKVTPIDIPARFEKGEECIPSTSISKKGYLRIKERGRSRNNFPLLYFLIDKGYGELLTQAQDQKHPRVFAKLQLSSVKPCNPAETDRNFCFILTTSEKEYLLQASNGEEYEEWMREIQDGIMQALDDCQLQRGRSHARGPSVKESDFSKTTKSCENVVERIKNVDGNTICADCNSPHPGWASTNIGVVICIECSGIHRGLGVQISKIKSLSLDKWDPILVDFMECHGNTKINQIFEANLTIPKITRASSKSERLDYIVAKYVNKSFCIPEELDGGCEIENNDEKEKSSPHTVNGNAEDNSINVDNEEHTLSDSTDDDNKGTGLIQDTKEDLVLSDSTDEDLFSDASGDASVTCLVKDCNDSSHIHPPNLT